VLDDASPLRQMSASVAAASAYLFKPATAYRFVRAGGTGGGTFDEGTPFPADEPQAKNPPYGAILDYNLNAPATVRLTIADAAGHVVRRWSSTDQPQRIDYDALDIPAYWVTPAQPPSGDPGAHRFVWDLRYRTADGPLVVPGRYTVTLTAKGRSTSVPLTVARDPRNPATVAGLQRQFDLAVAVSNEYARIGAAHKHSAELERVGGALQNLLAAIESADAAPTDDMVRAFAVLKPEAEKALK
jgi:hypothetical protein